MTLEAISATAKRWTKPYGCITQYTIRISLELMLKWYVRTKSIRS